MNLQSPKFLVMAYYTEDTPYEQEILKLEDSMIHLEIPYFLMHTPDRGSWQENTCMKPRMIMAALEMARKPILYVDADAIFHKYPTLMDSFVEGGYDFAYYTKVDGSRRELVNSTMFFNNSANIAKLLLRWIERINSGTPKGIWEQKKLEETVRSDDVPGLSTFALPVEYCKIFDYDCGVKQEDIVVEQFQASRRFRKHD